MNVETARIDRDSEKFVRLKERWRSGRKLSALLTRQCAKLIGRRRPIMTCVIDNGVAFEDNQHRTCHRHRRVFFAMRFRWSPGPVFAFESVAAARRWQMYALRSIYVGLLLAGLTLTWGPSDRTIHSLAEAAMIAGVFFRTLIAVQLAVVLLAAPAATASAVCVDKARGTLLHAFVTDLTDREIVLGKLGARLVPVLSLMACGLPVLALGSWLGGIDLAAVLGAELVTAGTAVVCCSLAFLASVWARKPHQALLLSYLLVGLWVAAAPMAHYLFCAGPTYDHRRDIGDVQPDPRRLRRRPLLAGLVAGPA